MVAKILVSSPNEVVRDSGYPQDNDIFILGTSNFFKNFTDGVIKANLESGSLDKANESFAGTIHSLSNSGNCGVVIISFLKKQVLNINEFGQKPSEKPFLKITEPKIRLSGILNSFLNKFQRKVYVRREEIDLGGERNKKTVLSVGIILLALLFISIGFGIKQKNEKELKSSYAEKLNQATHNFEESQTLLALDPVRARHLFVESRDVVNELTSKGIKDNTLTELQTKINENEGSILGQYRVKPDLYLDLTLLSNSFKADRLTSSNEDLAVLDFAGRKIVEITIESKKSKVVAGPDQIKDALDLALYSGRIFILSADGVYEVGDKADKLITKDWGDTSFIYAYAGNIYMLDKSNNNIYRFPGIGTSFAKKQVWLASGSEYDFSNFISWTVDGSIWIAEKNAQLYKYNQGVKQGFEITGVSPEVLGIDSIYTNEELEFLYILDRGNSRIVVLNKNGEFKAQYLDDTLGKAKSISVSEKEKKMIFLTDDSKLYSIEIKHI